MSVEMEEYGRSMTHNVALNIAETEINMLSVSSKTERSHEAVAGLIFIKL